MNHSSSSTSFILRSFKLSDADDILEYTGDDQVTKFLFVETMTTRHEALIYIKKVCMRLPWHKSICVNNSSIGFVSVFYHAGHKADIGYCIARKYWGQGIATQALKMSVKMVLKELQEIVRLQAFTDVENVGSQRVLEKAGFKKEGLLRKNVFIKGLIRDDFIYSFLSSDVIEDDNH